MLQRLIPVHLASQVYFGIDLLLGHARGGACPNCGAPRDLSGLVGSRYLGLLTIRSCPRCGLLYRPVGLKAGRMLELYYSFAYGDAGIATTPNAATLETLKGSMDAEGKDRRALIRPLLNELGVDAPVICVFGCSWGYEMLAMRDLGARVVGVEIGAGRREYGRQKLGLEIYDSVESLAAAVPHVDLIVSSHVLEHIPRLEDSVAEVHRRLRPALQVHITPCVEHAGSDPVVRSVIGREHPLGVTEAFWRRFAERHQLDLEVRFRGVITGEACGETVAILRRRPQASSESSQ